MLQVKAVAPGEVSLFVKMRSRGRVYDLDLPGGLSPLTGG